MAEGSGNVTRIEWGERIIEGEERFNQDVKAYAYLSQPEYNHKREQLYLLIHEGLSDAFARAFFAADANIKSLDLDLIRSIALIVGEDFVMKHLYRNTTSVTKAIELVKQELISQETDQFANAKELLSETKHLRDKFDLQMEFMQQSREQAADAAKELLQKETEKNELEKKLLEAGYQNKIRMQEETIRSLQEANEKYNRTVTEKTAVTVGDATSQNQIKQIQQKEGFIARWKRRRQSKLLLKVLQTASFRDAQLHIILQAVEDQMPYRMLKKLCNPALAPRNMELMERYCVGKEEWKDAK